MNSCRSRTDTEESSIIIKNLRVLLMKRYLARSSMLT